jgi:hypothetical protein
MTCILVILEWTAILKLWTRAPEPGARAP